MKRWAVASIGAVVMLAGCVGMDSEGAHSVDYIETPRDIREVERESVEMLNALVAKVEELRPGVRWDENVTGEDGTRNCDIGEDRDGGAYFTSVPRRTRDVPTVEEWQVWLPALAEIAGRYGYGAPSELPLNSGNHNVRFTTPEGDWLEVGRYEGASFSFRMKTICAPDGK